MKKFRSLISVMETETIQKNGATALKKVLLIPILICFVCVAFAQKGNEKTGSLLWKISGNGLKQPSYIFGTHHLAPISFLDSVAGVKQAFASCEQMVGELALQDMSALSKELLKVAMLPRGTTLKMLLSKDDYHFVVKQLKAVSGIGLRTFGLPILGRLKPAMVSLLYVVSFYQKKFPQAEAGESLDMWFQQEAVNRKMPVIGLETVQEQISVIFDVTPLQQQAIDLVCMLKNTDYLESTTIRINSLYRSADLSGVSEMFHEQGPCPNSTEQQVALNATRNNQWLNKLTAIMSDKSSFIAVGLLHLAGEEGLLHGLEQAGYTVEAVLN